MKTQKESQSRPTPGYRMPDMDRFLGEPLITGISPKARARYANIMYDTAFKLVFGSVANKSLLIELLEALIPGKKIADVSFHDKEIPGYFVGDKKTVFDLFCTTERKETFIVEMQLHGQSFFTDRVLFYSTYPLREQIVTPLEEERIRRMREAGDEDWQDKVPKRNYRLSPVYMVSILNFTLPHTSPGNLREGLVSSYSIRSDWKSGEQMTDALHFVFLELPRLKVGKEHPEKCLTTLEKIAFAFRHISFLQERPESFSGEFFEHLFHASELAGMSLDERNQYDKDMTTEIDKIAQLDYAMEQGLERGRKEGREEGRIVEKRDVARNLIHLNAPVEMICQATGLSPEEVLAL
jgi:hypothetical protein